MTSLEATAALSRIAAAKPSVIEAAWEHLPSPYEADVRDPSAIADLLQAIVKAALAAE